MSPAARLLSINTDRNPESEVEESSLREQVNNVIANRRDNLKKAVSKWLIYVADLGVTRVLLDECPIPLSRADEGFILSWLEDEGFETRTPRYMGRATIYLEQTSTKKR